MLHILITIRSYHRSVLSVSEVQKDVVAIYDELLSAAAASKQSELVTMSLKILTCLHEDAAIRT